MTVPPGVVVGVTQGVPVEFSVLNPIQSHIYQAGMASAATKGTVVYATSTEGQVDIATNQTSIAGLLGDDVINPAAIPAIAYENLIGNGFLFTEIGKPVNVWKKGEFFVTNVSGVVAYNDFLKPAAAGALQTNGGTNALTNGAIVCTQSNGGVSGGPIKVSVNLA